MIQAVCVKNKIFYGLILILLSIFPASSAFSSEAFDINSSIKNNGKKWTAGETSISKLLPKERGKRLGLVLPSGDEAADADTFISTIELPAGQVPSSFDWRNYDGKTYVTSIKDQESCSGCWAYATTAALESKILISNLMPGIDLDLSENLLLTCSDGGDCSGGSASVAADFLRDKGLTLENSLNLNSLLSCPADYPGISDCVYKLSDWQWVTKRNANAEQIKKALYKYGPLVTSMQVFTDLYFYESGIYSHVNGAADGYHSVVIVGYNDTEEYFIVKNSWGAQWGEEGFFRIAYSEIESDVSFGDWTMAFIDAGVTESPNIFVEPSSYSFGSTDIGGVLKTSFVVSNVGKAELLIGSIFLDGTNSSDFSISADTCSLQGLAPSSQCSLEVTFNPVSYGLKNASLVIPSNDSDTPQLKITLDGISKQTGTAIVAGQVKDEQGNPLFNVSISLGSFQTSTDKDGRYSVTSIPAGDYSVQVSKGGYDSISDILVIAEGSELIPRDFVLNKSVPVSNNPASDSNQETLGNGWHFVKGKPISIPQARAYFKKKKEELKKSGKVIKRGIITGNDPMAYPDELKELARALKYDPKLIYDYVHNKIDYAPYFGYKQGPFATYLLGRGNDFDQASLMIALLQISQLMNPSANIDSMNYAYGAMTMTDVALSNWLGVDNNNDAILEPLVSAGIPKCFSIYNGNCDVDRVWVKVTIAGILYVFDPAFKEYENIDGLDMGALLGYDRIDFLSSAGSMVENAGGPVYVQNLNKTNINNKLKEYSNNLINYIRANYANSNIEEILGSRKIVETNMTDYPVSLPFPTNEAFSWAEIPGQYTSTLKVKYSEGIEEVLLYTPDVLGRRLTLTFNSNNAPVLKLDGIVQATGNPTSLPSIGDLIMETSYQQMTEKIENGHTFALIFDVGGISDRLISKRREVLQKNSDEGFSDTSEEVLGETLNIMGLTYEKETRMLNNILMKLNNTNLLVHWSMGVMAQTSNYYVSIHGAYDILDKSNGTTPFTSTLGAVTTGMSALEHGMIEQLMGIDIPGISTTKIIELANDAGEKIFYLDTSTFSNTSSFLINYNMQNLRGWTHFGSVFYLPENGEISLNSWSGSGYMQVYKYDDSVTGIKMYIGGGLNGGHASMPGYVQPTKVKQQAQVSIPDISRQSNVRPQFSRDPVDMASGAFIYSNGDLGLSGLGVNRFYNSRMNEDDMGLGHGWSHNYDIKIKKSTNANPGLGGRSAIEAASTIASLYINLDLLQNSNNVLGWTVMALNSNWAVDQLHDNSVTVQIGEKVMEFIKLPDGSYSAPPGVTAELIDNGGTFTLKQRFNRDINFDANGKVTSITDADGNVISFSYVGDQLDIVQDSFGHSLDFDYVSDKLDKVTDSAGRYVSYDYDSDNNLVSYTDAEQKSWTYGYTDSAQPHRMTTMKNPLNQTTVTNIYDASGRVIEQVVPRKDEFGNDYNVTYNLYFSGYRNEEQDPDGFGKVYYYDDKGRVKRKEDELGNSVSYEYDGQNHEIIVTDPLLRSTTYGYDGFNNLTAVTNTLLQTTHYKYDSQFRQTDVTDPLDHNTHTDYDNEHHVTAVTDAETNSVSYTYYPNGKVHTTTDGRDVVTEVTAYDSNGNPRTTKVAAHPEQTTVYTHAGQLESLTDQEGSKTDFTYNNRGQLATKTDPLLKEVSMTYDDAGRLHSVTDRKGDTLTYDYTISGKMTFVNLTTTSGKTPLVSFVYNKHDELEKMTDELGSTNYTYYPNKQLETVTDPHGFALAYEYYPTGNVKKVTYPGNKSVSYTYDDLNRLETVTIDWLSQTATYHYDAAGRLDYMENFNGIITDPTFDNADRLTDLVIDNGNIASYNFTLDGNGNRTDVVKTEPLMAPRPSVAEGYTYNTQKNRLDAAGTSSFGYDEEGQLANKDGDSFTFDEFHRLRGISGSISTSYDYNGAGNRLKAIRNAVETRYIYDTSGNLVAEADSNNQVTRYYIYGAGLLGMVTAADQAYVYHFDANANVIALTDSVQQMVNKYAYTPFGIIAGEEEVIAQPFKFAGQVGIMTEPNGMYYMRARYYDPQVGRFISEDPLGFGGGDVNLFAYVGNNPVMFLDPYGKCPSVNPWSVLGPGNSYNTQNVYDGVDVDWNPSVSAGLFTVNKDSTGNSTDLAGLSIVDINFGKTSEMEAGVGLGRALGIAVNFDKKGNITGVSLHLGAAWPPSPIFFSISESPVDVREWF